jgi:hypothetical protein
MAAWKGIGDDTVLIRNTQPTPGMDEIRNHNPLPLAFGTQRLLPIFYPHLLLAIIRFECGFVVRYREVRLLPSGEILGQDHVPVIIKSNQQMSSNTLELWNKFIFSVGDHIGPFMAVDVYPFRELFPLEAKIGQPPASCANSDMGRTSSRRNF